MKLIFLRHAEYEPAQTRPKDGPLSERGRLQAATAGRWLRDCGIRPTHLLTTPRLRTRETARLALAELQFDEAVVQLKERTLPRAVAPWLALADQLRAQVGDDAVVLLVGHDPTQSLMRRDFGLPGSVTREHRAVVVVLQADAQGRWRGVDYFSGVQRSDTVVPDRSSRPESDPKEGHREHQTSGLVWLADGRAAVTELASVDGYTLFYVYFDVAGFEDADVEALDELLRLSGFSWQGRRADTEWVLGAQVIEDARSRPVWEFQVTYLPD